MAFLTKHIDPWVRKPPEEQRKCVHFELATTSLDTFSLSFPMNESFQTFHFLTQIICHLTPMDNGQDVHLQFELGQKLASSVLNYNGITCKLTRKILLTSDLLKIRYYRTYKRSYLVTRSFLFYNAQQQYVTNTSRIFE